MATKWFEKAMVVLASHVHLQSNFCAKSEITYCAYRFDRSPLCQICSFNDLKSMIFNDFVDWMDGRELVLKISKTKRTDRSYFGRFWTVGQRILHCNLHCFSRQSATAAENPIRIRGQLFDLVYSGTWISHDLWLGIKRKLSNFLTRRLPCQQIWPRLGLWQAVYKRLLASISALLSID